MTKYNVQVVQSFYGQKDYKTHFNVVAERIENTCEYLCRTFGTGFANIYDHKTEEFICTYSAKYKNYRYPNNKISKIFI